MNSFKCIFEMELPKLIFRGPKIILQQYSFDGKILKPRPGYLTFFYGVAREVIMTKNSCILTTSVIVTLVSIKRILNQIL